MTFPRLRNRIAEAGLDPTVARTFVEALRELVTRDPTAEPTKLALIRRVMGMPESTGSPVSPEIAAEPAPFEALWPHAELFLTACIYVALTDGQYGVEEARRISLFAHRLGLSARQLALLEARVFEELKLRGAARLQAGLPGEEDATEPGGPGQDLSANPKD